MHEHQLKKTSKNFKKPSKKKIWIRLIHLQFLLTFFGSCFLVFHNNGNQARSEGIDNTRRSLGYLGASS